jgi:hypothetical protein
MGAPRSALWQRDRQETDMRRRNPNANHSPKNNVVANSSSDVNPAMQRILRALKKKPNLSIVDLSNDEMIGMNMLTCSGYVRKLKRLKLIFISCWRKKNGRFCTPLFSWGSTADAPRPNTDHASGDIL